MTVPAYGAVVEHGNWTRYEPSSLPAGAPLNALYVRRDSDSADWYQFVNAGSDFQAGTLKMVVTNNVVSTATVDPTMLFPQDALVLEVFDTALDNPHEAWSRMVYDPATQTFSDPPPLPPLISTKDLLDRIETLEAKLGGV
jgi:hypothetical protein